MVFSKESWEKNGRIAAFKGIPYAAPPIGDVAMEAATAIPAVDFCAPSKVVWLDVPTTTGHAFLRQQNARQDWRGGNRA